MNRIAIITDTDCSLPLPLADQWNIRQVPITIHFGEETYTTGLNINDERLFELVDLRKVLPTTSAPSPGAFEVAYRQAFEAGADSVVCICVSSLVSATYSAALTAAEALPGRTISVIDSRSLSMGQGFMTLAAAEAAAAGASHEQVVAAARSLGERVHLFAVLPTLKYLAMSGRVGKVAAGLADTLNIKPLLTVREGKLDLLERIRTRKKAVERMLELTRAALDGKGAERAAIIHINNPAGARELRSQLCAAIDCPAEMIVAEFTPGLSVHAGSGVVGVAVVARP